MAIRLLGSYTDILKYPGTVAFSTAGFFGRVSRSTAGIATVLLVAGVTGSYTLAGLVSGAIIVGIAVGGPLWSRAVDASGQLAVLPIGLAASALSAVALGTVVLVGAPEWSWFGAAFLVGLTSIDMGSLARARWSGILSKPSQRHTALALESVNDELVFVIGPPVVTVLATTLGPVYGFATGIAVGILGGAALLLLRSTAPRPSSATPDAGAQRTSAAPRRARLPGVVLGILPMYFGVGLVFGSVDLSAISISTFAGQQATAGLILAVLAVGSVVAGIAFGPLSASWPAGRRVLVTGIAYALVIPWIVLIRDLGTLAVVVFLAGLVTAPVLISGISLIEARVDRRRLTEAMSWPSVGLAVGVTVGSAVAGALIDSGTAYSGMTVTAAGAVVTGIAGVVVSLTGGREPRRDPEASARTQESRARS
jgi:predicted MFS family arabinose efflux permease